MFRLLCAVAVAALSLVSTLPALASHEEPYIISEKKNIKNVWVCVIPDPLHEAFAALPDVHVMLQTISESVECFHLDITLEVLVQGQIGKDKRDENDVYYRIVHVKNTLQNSDLYLLVSGINTKVVQPSGTL